MTREELREIIEAVVAAQTALMDASFEMAVEKFMPLLQPGKLMPGLVFKVEAEEVRKLLRSRATSMREDAAEGEAGMTSALEDLRKSLDGQPAGAALAAGPPYLPGGGNVDEIVEDAKRRGIGKIQHLRESADRLDWQASHLDERTYMLSLHDLEAIVPEPTPPHRGVIYDPTAGFRATTRTGRAAGFGLPVR